MKAKAEELEIVRDMVNSTRYRWCQSYYMVIEAPCSKTVNGCTSIDLHGATLMEATQIVQEMVYNNPPTNGEGPSLFLPHCQLNLYP